MIEVKHLTKLYGSHLAVDDLSFTVEEGQVYGFLGPNGAGKSTTMNMMTGYLAISAGDVIVNGHSIITEPEEAKRTIGYLPEIPPLYMDMTVREYLTFAARLKKVPRREIKTAVAAAMEELDLTSEQNRLIRNLSKGYRQRTGFAQALLGDPETLILDEPTVGLDPKQIIEIRSLIKKLGKKHTVILSSHILSEVSEICDTVLIMSEGRLVACDTPARLAERRDAVTTVTVESPETESVLRKALEKAVGRENLSFSPAEEGLLRCVVTMKASAGEEAADPRRHITRILKEAGCDYYSVEVARASLEEIFLSLTETEGEGGDE